MINQILHIKHTCEFYKTKDIKVRIFCFQISLDLNCI